MILTFIRRALIVLFLLLLAPHAAAYWPEGKYPSDRIRELATSGEENVVEVGRSLTIDGDILHVDKIVFESEGVYLLYQYRTKENGWSFPTGAIRLFDQQGRELQMDSAGSSGRIWGGTGFIQFHRPAGQLESLTFKFDWYDRSQGFQILLQEQGEASP